ncbi:MAG: hypothetical protein MUF14_00745 [Hyphomonadaceae bacterium]|jgi:hypothetical protein|nr:hypothetical protein [Hyphomonadaceae bacterium]
MIRTSLFRTALVAAAVVAAGPAMADVTIEVRAPADAATLVAEVSEAARAICVDARAAGEIEDVDACVTAVVQAVAEESGNDALLAHVNGTQPTEAQPQPVRQAALGN